MRLVLKEDANFFITDEDSTFYKRILDEVLPTLPTRPWKRYKVDREATDKPEGNWTIQGGIYGLIPDEVWQGLGCAGVEKPEAEQLPVISCARPRAETITVSNVSFEDAAAFIRDHLRGEADSTV